MKHLYALVMMQLKDKLDFSFTASTQKLISKIVFTLLKFIAVAVVAYLLFSVLPLLVFTGGVPKELMVFIFGVIFFLSVLSCTAGLMKNLYFADDNKVLITFPVNANLIFLSRLIVFYIFELKKSVFLTIPIFIAFGLVSSISAVYYIWLFFAFIFISAVPVLVGALLSIPAMFVYAFVKKRAYLQIIIYVLSVVAFVLGAVWLIGLIPPEINLIEQRGTIERYIMTGLNWCNDSLYPVNFMVTMLCGYKMSLSYDLFVWQVPAYFGILVGIIAVLWVIGFVVSRPLFFSMMSKTFEFEKIPPKHKKLDIKHKKVFSFFKTQLFSLARSGQAGTFIGMYVAVPVLIYLLNKIFASMDTRLKGVYMVYSFNLLIMLLPMLASNAVIATLYSRDGRAAYITKTIPVSPQLPLIIKLIPMAVGSAISLVISIIIFASFVSLTTKELVFLCIGIVGMQWGHILWSGLLDLMNPQNEQYATVGEMPDNPNETLSTIIAFIVAAVYALFSFILFPEGVTAACLKLCLIGVVFAVIAAYMYLNKIKVYYYEK